MVHCIALVYAVLMPANASEQPVPGPHEFGPIEDTEDGRLSAVHKPSGGTIAAKTRDQLERRAVGTRIGATLRQAAEELRQRGRK